MMPESKSAWWATLEANSHDAGVQAIIRREISCGSIRVVSAPGDEIHIISASGTGLVREPEPSTDIRRDEHWRGKPVIRIKRISDE